MLNNYPAKAQEHKHAHLFDTICSLGGGKYVGVMPAFKKKNGEVHPDTVLFNSPTSGSTLAILAPNLSAQAVREKIAASNAEFERYQDKAVSRVLRQFSQPPLRVAA